MSNNRRGLAFILSAPAGTGKTTLVTRLTQELPRVRMAVTATTRAPRANEIDGVHYRFLTDEAFRALIAEGAFLEHVELFGARYGTLKEEVNALRTEGHHVILVIDTQGAKLLMEQGYDVITIFLMPPSKEALFERLQGRGTESAEHIHQRLSVAEQEIEAATRYEYLIINENLTTAYEVLRSIVIAEEHRNIRSPHDHQ